MFNYICTCFTVIILCIAYYAGANITVLLVETLEGEIFGGFATEQWHVDSSFYGSGESFIFKIGAMHKVF